MTARRLKILHTVESYPPAKGGMAEVTKQISEGLAAKGHDVWIATAKNSDRHEKNLAGVKIIEFDIQGNAVNGYKWGHTREYQNFLLNENFDILVNFAAQQWATDLALPILDKIKAKKVFVPTGFSALYNKDYSSYFDILSKAMHNYDANIFLSRDYRDLHFALSHKVKNCYLIPNGASEEEFGKENSYSLRKKLNISENHKLIVHVGSHTGVKGHQEMLNIFTDAKISSTTLLIIGNKTGGGCSNGCELKIKILKFFPFLRFDGGKMKILGRLLVAPFKPGTYSSYFRGKKILNLELNRQDTVSALKEADLFLFPSNIECSPIVFFEAAAAGIPFLCTDVGNSVEISEWLKCGKILPTSHSHGFSYAIVDKSAKFLEETLSDKLFLNSGKIGKDIWMKNYTWKSIVNKYEDLYLSLYENRAPEIIENLNLDMNL